MHNKAERSRGQKKVNKNPLISKSRHVPPQSQTYLGNLPAPSCQTHQPASEMVLRQSTVLKIASKHKTQFYKQCQNTEHNSE